ncbi:MAG: MarR family transcriptional regulator [Eubacterium sp.]|nr:MarR family transcriptional regulator [Eubacterium sp.]
MGEAEISPLVKILSDAIVSRVNRDFKQFNLTMQQMKILFFLIEREEAVVTQKEIQGYMKLTHTTVISILKAMEAKGFVKTGVLPEDKRVKTVCLTGPDEGIVKVLFRKKREIEDCLLRGFTQEERQNLEYYLEKMYQNIIEV